MILGVGMTFLSTTGNPETIERHMDRADRAELNTVVKTKLRGRGRRGCTEASPEGGVESHNLCRINMSVHVPQ